MVSDLSITISGPEAEGLAHELAQRLQKEFGGEYTPRPLPVVDSDERKVDPVTLAALSIVIALPGAVLSTMQLAERMKVVEKWSALRAWLQQRLMADQKVEISGETLPPKALTEAEPGEVIDTASEGEKGGV